MPEVNVFLYALEPNETMLTYDAPLKEDHALDTRRVLVYSRDSSSLTCQTC